jgi:hypothetical protein
MKVDFCLIGWRYLYIENVFQNIGSNFICLQNEDVEDKWSFLARKYVWL